MKRRVLTAAGLLRGGVFCPVIQNNQEVQPNKIDE